MITVSAETVADVERATQEFGAVQAIVDPRGLEVRMNAAVLGLQRFVTNNIEVDQGRTKNSIFANVRVNGNSVVGMLGSNVSYSPFVRNASHQMQFFKYAEQQKGADIARQLGDDVVVSVESVFD